MSPVGKEEKKISEGDRYARKSHEIATTKEHTPQIARERHGLARSAKRCLRRRCTRSYGYALLSFVQPLCLSLSHQRALPREYGVPVSTDGDAYTHERSERGIGERCIILSRLESRQLATARIAKLCPLFFSLSRLSFSFAHRYFSPSPYARHKLTLFFD